MHIDETFITKIGCRSEHFENIMQRLGDLIDREIILSVGAIREISYWTFEYSFSPLKTNRKLFHLLST